MSSPRTVLVNLRVTPAERDLMHARCRALGVTVSEAIRAILCRPPPTPKGPKP